MRVRSDFRGPNSHRQGRFPRCLVKGNDFRDPKRLRLTSEPLRARDRNADVAADAPFLALCHSNPPEGLELDRAREPSRNRTRLHRSERHLPESASSRKHEHDLTNARTSHARRLFSTNALAPTGAASREAPGNPGWRLEGACVAGRQTSSQRAHEARRPTGIRRAFTSRRSISHRRLVTRRHWPNDQGSIRAASRERCGPPRTVNAPAIESRCSEPHRSRIP